MANTLFDKLKLTCLMLVTLSQLGCITFRELKIAKDSPISKRPTLGCIENALDNFNEIAFEKFTVSCTNQFQISLKETTQCDSVTYMYYYKILSPSRDGGFSAVITIEIKNDKTNYKNLFQTSGHTNNLITNFEKKIIVDTLEKVDSHLSKVCGMEFVTKLSISDERPLSDKK